jgi:hypothetical protein
MTSDISEKGISSRVFPHIPENRKGQRKKKIPPQNRKKKIWEKLSARNFF